MGAAPLEGPPCRRPCYCFAWGELVACLAERCWWVKAVEVSHFLGQFPRHKKQVQRPDCPIPRARRSSVEGGHTQTHEVFRVGQRGEKLLSLRSHATLGR